MVKHSAKEVERKLVDSLEIFREETLSLVEGKNSFDKATIFDIEHMARHAFYVMNDFKNTFVEYIEQCEKDRHS